MRRSWWLALAAAAVLATPAGAQGWKGHARLDGRVTDPAGAPVEGATVTVKSLTLADGPVVTTDAEGAWVVDGIAAGSWMVEVTARGWEGQRIGVHLPHESAWLAPLNVELRRPPAPPAPPRTPAPPHREDAVGPVGDGNPADPHELRTALETGRIDRAHALLASLGGEVPEDTEALVEMGRLFLAAGQADDAVVVLDRAVNGDPAHAEARFRRALGLLALGQAAAARGDFEALLALSPQGPWAEKTRLALEQLPTTDDRESR